MSSHATSDMVEETSLERYLEHVRSLRDDWSDEIPSEILHSDSVPDSPPKVKARKNWFFMFSGWMAVGLRRNYLDPDHFSDMYSEFHQYLHATDFWHRLTTPEDIERVNAVLDKMIDYVERNHQMSDSIRV